jgi:hypothetical protein
MTIDHPTETRWTVVSDRGPPHCDFLPRKKSAKYCGRGWPAHAPFNRFWGGKIAAGASGGLVSSVHDELLLEVDENAAKMARDLLQRTMIDASQETFWGLRQMAAKATIGRGWAELKR